MLRWLLSLSQCLDSVRQRSSKQRQMRRSCTTAAFCLLIRLALLDIVLLCHRPHSIDPLTGGPAEYLSMIFRGSPADISHKLIANYDADVPPLICRLITIPLLRYPILPAIDHILVIACGSSNGSARSDWAPTEPGETSIIAAAWIELNY